MQAETIVCTGFLQTRKRPDCPTIRHVADLDPEVIDVLVRLMNDDTQLDELGDDALLALGRAAAEGTELAGRIAAKLNRRGMTFAKIGELWGVHESTAYRWAKAHGAERGGPHSDAPPT